MDRFGKCMSSTLTTILLVFTSTLLVQGCSGTSSTGTAMLMPGEEVVGVVTKVDVGSVQIGFLGASSDTSGRGLQARELIAQTFLARNDCVVSGVTTPLLGGVRTEISSLYYECGHGLAIFPANVASPDGVVGLRPPKPGDLVTLRAFDIIHAPSKYYSSVAQAD